MQQSAIMARMFSLVLSLAFIPTGQADKEMMPYLLTQKITQQLLQRLKKEPQKDLHQLRAIVHEKVMPYVHIHYMGALILGPHLSNLSLAEREAYFQAFQDYLEYSYARILAAYSPLPCQVEKERAFSHANHVTIRVHVQRNRRTPIRLDFKWRQNSKTGVWQLYDMHTEGVSIVVTKQQEWGTLLQQSGVDGLLKYLQRHTP